MRWPFLVLATAGVALSTPRAADACSQPACWRGTFVPADGGRVPANVPGLFWRPMSGYQVVVDPENAVLTSTAAPTTPLPYTAQLLPGGNFLLVPHAPLIAGGSYLVTDRTLCEWTHEAGPQATFSVGPEAAMPSELGALASAPSSIMKIDLATGSGSCSSEATVAEATIELRPSVAATAWMDALHFETWVDGKLWSYQTSINAATAPGASPIGRGRDRVFAVCTSSDPTHTGLAAGKHVVTMRATLPGTTKVAMSSSLEVELTCVPAPGDPIADPGPAGGGCSAAGPGAAPWLALAALALFRSRKQRSRRSARRRTV